MDAPARDSLACDLMEPVRPQVDAWVLDWITREPLKREWFFEQRDGNCRLMAPFAVRLSEAAPMWARAVTPLAE
jgi:CRISPR/Cas system-associated endonuclease Cas1